MDTFLHLIGLQGAALGRALLYLGVLRQWAGPGLWAWQWDGVVSVQKCWGKKSEAAGDF